MNKTSKILVIVEGARVDFQLMKHLLHIYGIDMHHEIVSYKTNIYTLYSEMFSAGDPSSIDILQLLKEREKSAQKKRIFDERYTDILLIFDLDPQDTSFSEQKISDMLQFFHESSDMGKLYLNYPMVEAFYHMKSIPDEYYNGYTVSLDEIADYKQRVNRENRNRDYSKFAITRQECNIVIQQNIDKAWLIAEIDKPSDLEESLCPDPLIVLEKQLERMETTHFVRVLCTCAFYIVDYNPAFIKAE